MNIKQVVEETLRSVGYRKTGTVVLFTRRIRFTRGKIIILISYGGQRTPHEAWIEMYRDKKTLELNGLPQRVHVSDMLGVKFGGDHPCTFPWGDWGAANLEIVNALHSRCSALKAKEKK